MPDASTKILQECASELNEIAAYLMQNRAILDLGHLRTKQSQLFNLRVKVSMHLSVKQQERFNANMDEAEDILDGLIRQITFQNHTGKNFTSDVRELCRFLQAAASLIWSLVALLISIHSHT
ncbi:MAG: hypothetical protein DYG98_17235 [Haliscomenobacteraceae bacterium CHB4]|nr:hypothetical protein [Saprospiraceae bacterium]MCE7924796.1 hypothetical protein [Haliscomenobacteraceae bacterium CHB4]